MEEHSNNLTTNALFYQGPSSISSRIIYTPSPFAHSLLYLQEVGELTAIRPHVSGRDHLSSFLFFVVKEGEGWLEYPASSGQKGEHYELKAGDCVFISCKDGYKQSSSEICWQISWVHFNSSQMPAIWNKYCERGGKPVFKPDNPSLLIKLFDDIYTTASSESYIRDVEINTLLSQLIGELFRETVYEENEKPVEMNTGAEKIDVGGIKSYIDTHYQDPLSLESLAEQFYFSKSYLARVFKETFGVTVNGYIALVRVGKAKELLRFTSKTVEEISYETGYGGDSNYFSRVFKKVEGVPPRSYRRSWVSSKEPEESVKEPEGTDKEKRVNEEESVGNVESVGE